MLCFLPTFLKKISACILKKSSMTMKKKNVKSTASAVLKSIGSSKPDSNYSSSTAFDLFKRIENNRKFAL